MGALPGWLQSAPSVTSIGIFLIDVMFKSGNAAS